MVTPNESKKTLAEQSPIDEAFGNLFAKIEKAEQSIGQFIGRTKSVRAEVSVKSESANVLESSPVSLVEAQINEAADRIDMIAYRVDQALAELRL